MKPSIAARIAELGGTYDFKGCSLQADLHSIRFDKAFLCTEFEDYLDDGLYEKMAASGTFPDEADLECHRITVQAKPFTPFTPGTADYQEWHDVLDEQEVRAAIGGITPEFLFIGETESYPNFYFVCLHDKNPDNPTVYSTDHEVYFSEIESFGTLEDFFNMLISAEEYQQVMHNLLDELRNL